MVVVNINKLFGKQISFTLEDNEIEGIVSNVLDIFDISDGSENYDLEYVYQNTFDSDPKKFVKFIEILFDKGVLDHSVVDTDDLSDLEINFLPTIYAYLKEYNDVSGLKDVIIVDYLYYSDVKGYKLNENDYYYFSILKNEEEAFWKDMLNNYVEDLFGDSKYKFSTMNIDWGSIVNECLNENNVVAFMEDEINEMDYEELIDYAKITKLYKQIDDVEDMNEEDLRDEVLYRTQIDHVKRYIEEKYNSLIGYMKSIELYDDDVYEEIIDYGFDEDKAKTIACVFMALEKKLIDYNCVKKQIIDILESWHKEDLEELFDIVWADWVEEFTFEGKKYSIYYFIR